jgi:AraC-like DNA-binding protein
VKEVAGMSANAFISERIVLVAKRLLAQTPLPASAFGEERGFDEATNFTKFFHREVGRSPSNFRRLQTAHDSSETACT